MANPAAAAADFRQKSRGDYESSARLRAVLFGFAQKPFG
jgi:hypothetical protein